MKRICRTNLQSSVDHYRLRSYSLWCGIQESRCANTLALTELLFLAIVYYTAKYQTPCDGILGSVTSLGKSKTRLSSALASNTRLKTLVKMDKKHFCSLTYTAMHINVITHELHNINGDCLRQGGNFNLPEHSSITNKTL